MIVESEAIVLRSRKQGETSKIVTLYTRSFGKVNVIAKGAREQKSKFGGALEMFARVNVVFYKKEKPEGGLYLLSKADLVNSNGGILKNLDKIQSATAIVELVLRAMHDEEEHPEIFELMESSLAGLSIPEEKPGNGELPAIIQLAFQIQFLRAMGFEAGEEAARALSQEAREMLKEISMDASGGSGIIKKLLPNIEHELHGFFRAYFAEHLPGMNPRSMRSGRVFSAL